MGPPGPVITCNNSFKFEIDEGPENPSAESADRPFSDWVCAVE